MIEEIQADPGIERMLDGNAAAGLLHEIFGSEMTAMPAECAHCGNVAEMGALLAFVPEMGMVLRCPTCGRVVIRIVRTNEAIWLDARGAAYLRIPLAQT